MEHRWSARKSFQRSVVVDCPRIGPASVKMCDVSLGGMFVETGRLLLPLDAPVFVAFNLAHNEQHDDFRLEAMVVRHAPVGAGLMFLDLETDVLRALRGALYDATTSAMSRITQARHEVSGFTANAQDRAKPALRVTIR
jgi:hypothetical protein